MRFSLIYISHLLRYSRNCFFALSICLLMPQMTDQQRNFSNWLVTSWQNGFFSVFFHKSYSYVNSKTKNTLFNIKKTEPAVRRCSKKWVLLKIFQNPQENIFATVSFSITLHAFRVAFYYNGDIGTGFFLCILQNFHKHFL